MTYRRTTTVLPRHWLCCGLFVLCTIGLLAQDDVDSLALEERYQEALALAYGLNGVEVDRRAAISLLKVVAQEGDATSQNLLGSLYSEQIGIFGNYRKANDWFEKAASQNNPYAQYNLAFSYRIGRGVKRDDALAERYFQAVVSPSSPHKVTAEDFHLYRQTVASAHYQLGGIYSDFASELRDRNKAAASMEIAEAGGVPLAALYLATQYAVGEYIEKDLEKADYYLERYPLLAENELRLSARSMYFEGMDREEISTMAELADKLQDGLSEQIIAMQTSFGASLLKPGESYDPEMARRWLEAANNSENHAAKLMLSRIYYHGLGIEKNLERARELLERASRRYPVAKFNLGMMVLKGEGGQQSPSLGRRLIREASEEQLYVAYRYLETGMGLREYSPEEAMAECRLDSDAGNIIANFCLGYRYLKGLRLPRDERQARKLIETAAEAGFAPAEYAFGVSFPNMIDRLSSGVKLKWIERSAGQGYLPAKLHLGREKEAMGTSAGYAQAAEVYRECADAGMGEAMTALARLLQSGRGLRQDEAEALVWLNKAIDLGELDAYRAKGEAYRDGLGLEIDFSKARSWFEKGAHAGHVYSQYDLARLLTIMEKEELEASAYWFERAAESGHYNAMYEIAECYRFGRGVTKSRILAAQWYGEAARGSRGIEAMYEYARLVNEAGWSQSDPEVAERLFYMLEGKGFVLAKFEIAKILARDKSSKKRLKKAYARFKKVAEYKYFRYDQAFGKETKKVVGRIPAIRFKSVLVENRRLQIESAAVESARWLARMTELGEGVKADSAVSIGWYRLAAEAGDAIAQYELAVRLRDRRFSNRSDFDFIQLLRRSADSGYRDAQFEVGRLHFQGTKNALDRETSIEYLKRAADQDHGEARALLKSEKIEYDKRPLRAPESKELESEDVFASPLVG